MINIHVLCTINVNSSTVHSLLESLWSNWFSLMNTDYDKFSWPLYSPSFARVSKLTGHQETKAVKKHGYILLWASWRETAVCILWIVYVYHTDLGSPWQLTDTDYLVSSSPPEKTHDKYDGELVCRRYFNPDSNYQIEC